ERQEGRHAGRCQWLAGRAVEAKGAFPRLQHRLLVIEPPGGHPQTFAGFGAVRVEGYYVTESGDSRTPGAAAQRFPRRFQAVHGGVTHMRKLYSAHAHRSARAQSSRLELRKT